MNPIANQFSSIEKVTDQYLNKQSVNNSTKTADVSFEDILKENRIKVLIPAENLNSLNMQQPDFQTGIFLLPLNKVKDFQMVFWLQVKKELMIR